MRIFKTESQGSLSIPMPAPAQPLPSSTPVEYAGSGGAGEDAPLDRPDGQHPDAADMADPIDALRSDEVRLRVARSLSSAPELRGARSPIDLPPDFLDASINDLIDGEGQRRARRAVPGSESNPLNRPMPGNLIPFGVGGSPSVLTRINEWFRTNVLDEEGGERNTDIGRIDRAIQGAKVRVHTGGTDWGKLGLSVQTATQAALRVASTAYDEHGPAVAEAFIMKLFDGQAFDRQPSNIREVVNREWVRLHNLAAVLHAVSRQGPSSDPQLTISLVDARRHFTNALREEDLRRAMFKRDSQPGQPPGAAVYFDGNALANAAGKSFDDLVQDPSLARLPRYMELNATQKCAAVKQWLDERGLDAQYQFGTVENAMASVLKGAALARGEKVHGDYATPADLGRAFLALAHDWRHDKGCLIDPRILLGLNLAKTRGVVLAGNTVAERLADLRSFVNDVLSESDGPPRFDRRAAALESLARESGLVDAVLLTPLRSSGKSIVDTFLALDNAPPDPDAFIAADDGTRISVAAVAQRVQSEELVFLATEHRDAPYFKALARLQLRKEQLSLTDAGALETRAADLAKSDRNAASDAQPSALRHWLDNTPVVSNVIGFGEGVYTGNLAEIVNAVPVLSNFYNLEEGVRTGDVRRAVMAAVTLVPFLGSVATVVDGAVHGDAAEVVGGLEGLAIDFYTYGEGHLLTTGRTFRSVAAHTAVDEAKTRPGVARVVPHEMFPSALQSHANQSLTALSDLGARAGEQGLALRVEPQDAAIRRAPNKRTDPVSVVRSRDDARLVNDLEHYKMPMRPRSLEPGKDGMLWDPVTAAHYAELGGGLYRVATDRSKSTPGRPIWNVVSSDGARRKATIRLEYVVDRAKNEGRWQIARNLPGLKGGMREVQVDTDSFVDRYYQRMYDPGRKDNHAVINQALSQEAKGLKDTIDSKNTELALGLDRDVDDLNRAWGKMKTGSEAAANAIKNKADKAEIARHKQAYDDAETSFVNKLQEVGPKVNGLLDAVDRINREVGAVVEAVRPGGRMDGKIMRVMSEAEAKDIKDNAKLRQGGTSFEQHKWFYTDRNHPPVPGKSTPYRLEIDVPQSTVQNVLGIASDNPDGKLEPFRRKTGASKTDTTALEQEERGAFGVQRFGLEAFSNLLTKCKWRIVKAADGAVFASGGGSGG
jgi:hypothetical protein